MKPVKAFLIVFQLLLVIILFSCKGNMTIKWYSSTSDKIWEEERNLLWCEIDSSANLLDAIIYPDSIQQTILGFGGEFSELGWKAIETLNPHKKMRVINELFSKSGSLKLTLGLLPIGANNYAENFYTLNDSANDFEMDNFSIDRDKKNMIPFIHEALRANSDLRFIASPWSPPVWMKSNKLFSSSIKELSKDSVLKDQIILNDTILNSYARYFVKYCKAYNSEDIDIECVNVQNNYTLLSEIPSCYWTNNSISMFTGKYLGPILKKNKLETKIWINSINTNNINDIDSLLLKNNTFQYVKGLGFNWNARKVLTAIHNKYPQFELLGEVSIGNDKLSWNNIISAFMQVEYFINSGANFINCQNLVLPDTYNKEKIRNKALININMLNSKTRFNPEFFLLKHFSGNIPTGSRKVKMSGKLENTMSFVTPNDNLIIIIANFYDKKRTTCIKVNDKLIKFSMAANSVNSLECFNIK